MNTPSDTGDTRVRVSARRLRLWGGVAGALLATGVATGAATLDTRTVVLDGQGKLLPWTPDPTRGYHQVMSLSWNFLANLMPVEPANGLPVIYTHSEYQPDTLRGSGWPNNPAGKNAMLADAARFYYAYTGDPAVISLVRGLLDHQLQFGTTPTNYAWAGVPWSTAASGSVVYGNDDRREGVGVLEPDKVGELGYHGYLVFYQMTGETNYLRAALACADALALHVREGGALNSPWPFRVRAQNGQTAAGEEYCAHVIAPIRLFDELIRLGLGDTNAYQVARQTAWDWMMTHPMANQKWANYFEDVEPISDVWFNLNQYSAMQTARYLLERPELDPDWQAHSSNLLSFVESTFGGTDKGEAGLQFGARVISEQINYKYKMASHTARFGAVQALRYAATSNAVARETAYRSLNWATYMCRSNGVVIEGPAEFSANPPCWFTDGHGDYIRHFMLALGAVPAWAPTNENHILQCSSVVQSAMYHPDGAQVSYRTFDAEATTTLRLAFTPVLVLLDGQRLEARSDLLEPGWVYDGVTGVLRVRHQGGHVVEVLGAGATDPDFAEPLQSGAASTGAIEGGSEVEQFYRFSATGEVARLQFELKDLTADLTLLASRGLPPPSLADFDYQSAFPGTHAELILVFPDSQPEPVSAGDWYLTVVNTSGLPASYSIRAAQDEITGHPIRLSQQVLENGIIELRWNSLPGASYVVSVAAAPGIGPWEDVSPSLVATGSVSTFVVPQSTAGAFFRVREGAAIPPAGAP